MPITLRKGVLLSALLALCLSLVSCDLFGSDDDSSPNWAGKWRVTAFDDGDPPESPQYWNASENKLKIIIDTRDSDTAEDPCTLAGFDVVNQDGNIVTIRGRTSNVSGDEAELQLETSGGTMTATVLDSEDDDSVGNEIELSSASEIPVPQDEESCATGDT